MKKLLSLWVMAAMLLPVALQAQQTLTVADGTSSISTVPFDGYNADYAQHNQVLYPASMLADMNGMAITQMVFYIDASASNGSYTAASRMGTWTVSLAEVTQTTLSGLVTSASLQEVYEGYFDCSTGTLTLEFSEPYVYGGGNLLLDLNHAAASWNTWYFLGIESTGASYTRNTQRNFLPKTTFTYTAPGSICRRPVNFAIDTIDATSATLSWQNPTPAPLSYTLQVINGIDTNTFTGVTSPYTVTGLNASTPYTFRLQADCGAEQSTWATITRRTACAAITLPFSEGFEGMATGNGNYPPCWTVHRTSTSNYDNLFVRNEYAHSGSNCMYFYPYGNQWIVSEAINDNPADLYISFWAQISPSVQRFEVGLMTDPDDTNTFSPYLVIRGGNNSTYTDYELYTDTCSLSGPVYVAFRAYCTNGFIVYLDDIYISTAPACRRPVNPLVLGVTYNTASLSWEDESFIGNYDVAYGTSQDVAAATIVNNVTDLNYTLTDLNPATTYNVWVRGVCGGEPTDWKQFPSTFTTDFTCYPIAGASVGNTTRTSASLSWQYANRGRGYEPTGVSVILTDVSDTNASPVEMELDGTSTFLTGLTPGHSYRAEMRTVCDPDTASAVTLTFSTNSCGEVISESGTAPSSSSNYSSYYPLAGYYKNNYSQSLYPMDVVSGMDTIYGVSWQAYYTGSNPYTISGIDIYMGTTNVNSFSSASSYIAATNLTQVATGKSVTVTSSGWVTVTFDTPYVPAAGMSNLVVTVFRNDEDVVNPPSFYYHSTSGSSKHIYNYTDSPLNLTSPTTGYNASASYSRPNIRFVGSCSEECFDANLMATGSDVSSVDLEWVAGGDESSWVLQYRADSDTVWTEEGTVSASAATGSYTVSNLQPRTRYYFRLGTECSSGDTLWSNTASIYTGCVDMELPYSESFEGLPTSEAPLCWNTSVTGSGSAYVTSSNAHDGSNSMYLYPTSATSVAYLVSSAIPADPTELEINFWARISGGDFTVGLVNDPSDLSSFTPLMVLNGGNGNTYTEYTLYTDTVSLTGTPYLAFRFSGSYSSCFLDEVGIAINSGCIRPSDVITTSVLANEASIAWTGDPAGTYEMVYSTVNDPTADTLVHDYVQGDTNYTITGLEPNTHYYAWVRTNCGGYSTLWSVVEFTTPCAAYSLPFEEDFESSNTLSTCWSRHNGAFDSITPSTTTTSGWNLVTPSSYNINNVMSGNFIRMNIYNSTQYWLISPTIDLSADAVLTFDLALTAYSSSGGGYGSPYIYGAPQTTGIDDRFLVAVSTDGTHWTPLAQWSSDSTGSDYAFYDIPTTPESISLPLTAYTGEQVRIAFFAGSTVQNADNYLWLDNVVVSSGSCMSPSMVRAIPTDTTVTLTWVDVSTEPAGYEVVLSPSNSVTDAAAITVTSVTDTFYTFTGLTDSTQYYWFVRSLCNPEVRWVSGNVKTECGPLDIPYYTGFEGLTVNNNPDCWQVFEQPGSYGSTYNTVRISSSYVNSGSRSLRFTYSSQNNIAIMPATRVELNTLQVRCFTRSESTDASCGTFEIGYVSDPTDTTTFVALATFSYSDPNADVYHEEEVPMTSAPAGARAAFRHKGTGNYYWHIDDLHLEPASSCARPTNPAISAVSYNGATFSWSDTTAVGNYEVRYDTVNDVNSPSALTVLALTDTTYTETAMAPGTTYYVWVRANCGEEQSNWTVVGNFTTDITCYPIANLQRVSTTSSAAGFTWEIDERGFEATSVMTLLEDLTDTTVADIVAPANGLTYHFFTGLAAEHTYRATFYTVCDPDTANAVSSTFMIAPEACASIVGSDRTWYAPLYGSYKYGFGEVLYPASALAGVDTIRSVSFSINTVSTTVPTRTVSLYLGHTNRSSFSIVGANYVSVDSLTQVLANATMDVSSTGWVTLNLTTPFAYDGTSNLVLGLVNHTGSWNGFYFDGETATDTCVIQFYDDYTVITTSNFATQSSLRSVVRPNTLFHGNCAPVACPAPMAVVSGTDTTSISLTWIAGGNETQWTVEYSTDGATWTTAASVSTPTYTVTSLTPASFYYFRVGALCSDETAYSNIVSAFTDCAPLALPFYEGFNSDLSECWILNGTSASTISGHSVRYLSNISNRLITPALRGDLSGYQVRMNANVSNASHGIRVGVTADEGATIEWIDTLTGFTAQSGVFDEVVVYLNGYTGTGDRVVVASYNSSTSNYTYVYIDDLWIEPLENCMAVDNLVLDGTTLTESSAEVFWTPRGSESQWLVYVDSVYIATTTTPSYVLTSLDPNTSYEVAVRAFCGGTDTSRIARLNFRTSCGAIASLPWTEDFEGFETSYDGSTPDCWEKPTTPGYLNVSTSYPHGASYTKALQFHPNSSSNAVIAVLPTFATPINGLEMEFWSRPEGTSSGTFSVGYVLDATDTASFVEVAYYEKSHYSAGYGYQYMCDTVQFTSAPVGARIAFRYNSPSTGSNWYWYVDDITVRLAEGVTPVTYYTVALSTADATMGSVSPAGTTQVEENQSFTATATANEGYLFTGWMRGSTLVSTDNPYTFTVTSDIALTAAFVEDRPCLVPTAVTTSNVTFTSVVVSWTPGEDETAWEVNIVGTNFDTTIATSTIPLAVADLNADVTYTVKVRANCSENYYSDWSEPAQFTTESCHPVTGLTATATSYSTATVSWTPTSNSTGTYEVEYGAQGFRRGNGTRLTVSGTSTTIEGLEEQVSYDVYVRASCNEGIYSNWSDVANFTTLVGIDDVMGSDIALYPNPATTTVTISGIAGEATVSIIDLNGREMSTYQAAEGRLDVDLTHFAQGTYFVRITGNSGTIVRKLVVK